MLFVLLALLPHSFLATTDMLASLCLLLPLWIFLRGKATATVCLQAGLAAGLAYGESAAAVATVVKLTRNALMAPILVGVGVGMARHRRSVRWQAAAVKSIPLFVLGFLAMALLNTLGVFPARVRSALIHGSRVLILAALAGIGLSLRVSDLRVVGLRPFLVGLGASVGLAAATLLLTTITQGVWEGVFGKF